MKILKLNLLHGKNFALIYSKLTSTADLGVICKRLLSSNSSTGDTTSQKDYKNYKVVFIGSDTFSLPTLIELTKLLTPDNVSVVVSNENNLVGKCAKNQKNQIYRWDEFKKANFSEGNRFELGVVASFGYLIPAKVINRFPLGILNVHASLLPRWRGASPINHSIIFGDTCTGVSIMKIAPHRFDVGPVLLKKSMRLDEHIKAPDLHKILADLGAKALIEVIKDLQKYLRSPIYQDDSLATLAPKLTPEMAEVDWEAKTAIEVYRLYRGLYGVYKLRTTFNERRIDLDEIELPDVIVNSKYAHENENKSSNNDNLVINCKDLPSRGVPGGIVYIKDKNVLIVRCADSSGISTWLCVRKVKIGLKWMAAKDFRNGFLSKGKVCSNTIPRFYLSKSVIEDKLCKRNLNL